MFCVCVCVCASSFLLLVMHTESGGAVKLINCNSEFSDVDFSSNSGATSQASIAKGGALYLEGGKTTLRQCTFFSNSVTNGGYGGAVYGMVIIIIIICFLLCLFSFVFVFVPKFIFFEFLPIFFFSLFLIFFYGKKKYI